MSINSVTIAGNLTRNPELKQTQSGFSVLHLGIAVNERMKNKQTEEWEDNPNFFDVTMLGKRAESVARFLSKGSKVTIQGKLRWSSWEKDGQKRSKVEIIADEIEFMSRNEGGQTAQPASGYVDEDCPF